MKAETKPPEIPMTPEVPETMPVKETPPPKRPSEKPGTVPLVKPETSPPEIVPEKK